ncbi:ornithine carbamoyltransferase [Sphingomonas sp. CGMCC 1.13654]|uniref:Ornithine carbamoyltransferase n=1 Tax=Sphingomonas chungangi TaxID=2683589 RepID=A0A838LEJ2_9SPHN|nr:ornithine carbamoyltransferase [Sphingomonas chungangi]MBA2935878.1 ornithine carbamoyltransferase [Sphingomonas chungangi]MVW54569.1 ornithine carbamoyltransferase [Sphingomonas chungangi]
MTIRHFLDLSDAGTAAITAMLADAKARKAARATLPKGAPDPDRPLEGRTLAMIFEKNSTRTRVSFDMAMRQLGGTTLILDAGTTQLGRGETVADTARVLSRMVDAIMIRTDDHAKIVEMARHATVPVINGLTDASHPCQIMADMQTVIERRGSLAGSKWAWLGDGNNVLHSIVEAGSLMGFEVVAACPEGYDPDVDVIGAATNRGGKVRLTRDAAEAAAGADIVVTDTWISMGQKHAEAKLAAMMPYQVTAELMAKAKPNATFLHCLPAHRGEEVVDAVIDGPQSAIWDEAENRLHAQKSVLLWCFGKL